MFPNEYKNTIFDECDPQQERADRTEVRKFAKGVKVVIQSCNEYEYYAALELTKPPTKLFERAVRCDIEHTEVTLGMFAGCKAAIVWTKQGVSCMTELQKILHFFSNPKALLGLGVAFGMDENVVRFCDVLVANQIIDYAERPKIVDGKLQHRGQILNTKKTLDKIFCKDTTGWKFACTKGDRLAKPVIGKLVSSPNLINDAKFKQGIKEAYPDAKGGEMEGWVHYAHIQDEFPTIEAIIIKGVADYGDGEKVKTWQLSAAKAAVNYAHFQLGRSSVYKESQPVVPLSHYVLISLCVCIFAIVVAVVLGRALY